MESILRARLAPPPENKKAPLWGLFVFSPSEVWAEADSPDSILHIILGKNMRNACLKDYRVTII
jgi:hypothetical protein